MEFLYIKAVHIIFVVSWFAGLFYIVRLFVYHAESFEKSEQERAVLHPQYSLMEKRLMNIITTPAMILTLLSGVCMIYLNPDILENTWLQIKLGLVLMLVMYHIYCQRIMRGFVAGNKPMTSTQLRLWNEGATLLLVSIVFLVVLKNTLSMFWGVLGLVALSVAMMIAVKLYKKNREKK